MSGRDLIKFVVLDIEPIAHTARPSAKRRGTDRKMRLAEVTVARESDFGSNDIQFVCVTHLGHILREGDLVMGYVTSYFSTHLSSLNETISL